MQNSEHDNQNAQQSDGQQSVELRQSSADLYAPLSSLNKQIQKYVFVQGIAQVLLVVGCLFWISMAVDWLYFRSQMLELPLWVRQLFLFGTIIGLAAALFSWVFSRYFSKHRSRSLALILEKKFPELDDRLITAIEFDESGAESETPLSQTMLGKTKAEVSSLLGGLDIKSVFDPGPLRRSVMFALVLLASIVAMAVVNQEAMARWTNGYLFLQKDYWDRNTRLDLHIVAQPNDTVKKFKKGYYKHPNGEELTIIATSTLKPGVKEPSRVNLTVRRADGSKAVLVMTNLGDGRYRKAIPAVKQDLRIWVSGGDFINREAYRITVVEPPRIDQVTLFCQYPDYTHKNRQEQSKKADEPAGVRVPIISSKTSVPLGTRFVLRAKTNKPLTRVDIRSDRFEVSVARNKEGSASYQTTLLLKSEEGNAIQEVVLPAQSVGKSFSENRLSFDLDFASLPDFEKEFEKLKSTPQWPLPMQDDTKLRIYLSDEDGVQTVDPIRMAISSVQDQIPSVETERHGISNTITARARIPISGMVEDDYGVVKLAFRYGVNLPVPDKGQPASLKVGGNREYKFGVKHGLPNEVFDVASLGLEIGQTMSLTLAATDGNTVTGAQTGRGDMYQFKIVSDEELKSILYQRELTLRRRLEQIISELVKTSKDLTSQNERYGQALKIKESGKPVSKETPQLEWELTASSLRDSFQRAEYAMKQNGMETALIKESFQSIRLEMINNDIASPKRLVQLNSSIIRPLGIIATERFPEAEKLVTATKERHLRAEDPTESVETSVAAIDEIVDALNSILREVLRQESLSELIERVKNIRKEQEKLYKQTKEEKKRKLIELKGLGLE